MFPVLSRMAMDIISVQASSVASESAFSTSGRVLSIRRTRLTPASLEMCMCLKDHLDAKERKQDKCPLETPLDFEEGVFDDEVQQNEAIPLSDEEIALDASSEGTMSPGGPRGQSEALVGQGSVRNHGCRHRLPSTRVLRKCLICTKVMRHSCFFRGYLLLPRLFSSSTAIASLRRFVVPVRLGSDPFLLFTMSNITDIKSVLTQKGLDMFCHKFHIPNDVHLQLPGPNQTIHEMHTGKIGVYTRFFEYANFRLPLFTFLVNVLRHYHINLSQLSVIAAAKVSHFEILCRVHNIEPTVRLFSCFYMNSKNKGWMSFSKRPDSDT
ncbi:zinc finger BED domain-containing protein RICESLEEPER 2, partial [Tanacetum coccineum]